MFILSALDPVQLHRLEMFYQVVDDGDHFDKAHIANDVHSLDLAHHQVAIRSHSDVLDAVQGAYQQTKHHAHVLCDVVCLVPQVDA